MKYIKHFEKNQKGNDYVVGDIHGMFSSLEKALKSIGFDVTKDRLFSVGDLIDRGTESNLVLEWLEQDWFFPVMGNHEEMLIFYEKGQIDTNIMNSIGGQWALSLTKKELKIIVDNMKQLPIGIEVETDKGLIGIIHADCPTKDWGKLEDLLDSTMGPHYLMKCLWSTDRAIHDNVIEGVEAIMVGHMTQDAYNIRGNAHMLDTKSGYPGGYLTILDLNTLLPMPIPFD